MAPPPAAEAPLWWVWLAAWPVTAVFALSNAATPLYVLWQRDIGFSKGALTVVFAFSIVGLLGSLLVCGVLSDRLGRKPVLLPALGLALVARAVFATASSVTALIVARLLTGVAVGAAVSAGMAAVTDMAGERRRRLGALLASCAMVLGAGLGPFLSGLLSEALPAPTVTVFLVEMALPATALLVMVRMPAPRPAASATVALVGAVHASSVVALLSAAVLAGAGQGMGQLGGLSLLSATVAPHRPAEANSALNMGGYLLAGSLPVAAGFLSDAAGLTTGATVFAGVLAALAAVGGLVVVTVGCRVPEIS